MKMRDIVSSAKSPTRASEKISSGKPGSYACNRRIAVITIRQTTQATPRPLRQLRISQRMSPPEQLFQLRTAEHAPVLQRDPVDACPIRRRHNALSLQQLAKSLRPGSKRQHRPPILLEIELREHLAAILLRPHPPPPPPPPTPKT